MISLIPRTFFSWGGMLGPGLWSIFLKLSSVAFSFLLSLALVKQLGAKESGYYFWAFSVLIVASVLVRSGSDQVIVREVAKLAKISDWVRCSWLYQNELKRVFALSTLTFLLFSIAVVLLPSDALDRENLKVPLLVMAASIIPYSLYTLCGNFFLGLGKYTEYNFSQGLALSVCMLLVLSIYSIPVSRVEFLSVSLMFFVVTSLIAIVLHFRWRAQAPDYRHNLTKDAGKLGSLALLLVEFQNISLIYMAPIIIGFLSASSDVAVFSMASRTAIFVSIIFTAVGSMIAPKLAQYYSENDVYSLRKTCFNATKIVFIICFPLALLIFLFPDWVMSIYGEEFKYGAAALTVLVLGQLVKLGAGPVGILLTMTGNERYLLRASLVSVVFLVFLCLILVPKYGALGAAISQFVAVFAQTIVSSFCAKKLLGFSPVEAFFKRA